MPTVAQKKHIAQCIKPFLTKENALKQFEKLRKNKPKNNLSSIGSRSVDFFTLYLRLDTKVKGESFYEYWKNKNQHRRYIDNFKKKYKLNALQAAYKSFELRKGVVSSFRPNTAAYIYDLFKPGTTLDISAGWGGRMVGAMARDVNYIGFDTNKALKPAYNQMIKTYGPLSNSRVRMFYQDSSKTNFSRFHYDMIFTSPPYFSHDQGHVTEDYMGMPVYREATHFYEQFLFRAVCRAWDGLASGGVMVLNIPITNYQVLKTVVGPADRKIEYPKRSMTTLRHEGSKHVKEYMYVWKKTPGRHPMRVCQEYS